MAERSACADSIEAPCFNRPTALSQRAPRLLMKNGGNLAGIHKSTLAAGYRTESGMTPTIVKLFLPARSDFPIMDGSAPKRRQVRSLMMTEFGPRKRSSSGVNVRPIRAGVPSTEKNRGAVRRSEE